MSPKPNTPPQTIARVLVYFLPHPNLGSLISGSCFNPSAMPLPSCCTPSAKPAPAPCGSFAIALPAFCAMCAAWSPASCIPLATAAPVSCTPFAIALPVSWTACAAWFPAFSRALPVSSTALPAAWIQVGPPSTCRWICLSCNVLANALRSPVMLSMLAMA